MAVYKNNSPYRDTGQNSMYLELLNITNKFFFIYLFLYNIFF